MVEASFVAAFAGGLLALLSPCSALLLPAFFAYAFTSRTELLGRTLLFLAGLCSIFLPLGLGASVVAALLIDRRETTILVAGLLLIAFGVLELLGRGFSLVPPGLAARFQGGGRSAAAVYGTGLVYGLSGFCSGPLLGAVLTVAASSANPLVGAALLFTYSLGTAAPLFVLAWLWDHYRLGSRSWLRGGSLRIGLFELHSTNLVAGTLFILLGVSFIAFQGSSVLSGLYADLGLDELGFRAQLWIADAVGDIPEAALVAGASAAIVLIWVRRRHRGPAAAAVDELRRDAADAVG